MENAYYAYLRSLGFTGSLETTFAVPPDWTELVPQAPMVTTPSPVPTGAFLGTTDPWSTIDGIYPADSVNGVVSTRLSADLLKWGLTGFLTSQVASVVINFFNGGLLSKAVGFLMGLAGTKWLLLAAGLLAAALISLAIYNWLKRGKRKGKRYSIGRNPRLLTLLKVAKLVDNIFVAYNKRVGKYARRTKDPGRKVFYADSKAKRDITVVR